VKLREDYLIEEEEDEFTPDEGDFEDEEELEYEVDNDMIDDWEQGFAKGFYGHA
jgi:hypothetical protein